MPNVFFYQQALGAVGELSLPPPPPKYYVDHYAYNAAYFCNTCGEIWFRACCPGNARWSLHHVSCLSHSGGFIWHWHYNRVPLSAFPEKLLKMLFLSLFHEEGRTLALCPTSLFTPNWS